MPTEDGKHSLFVGKVDSVVGIEYKTRKAPERFGITPSLLARYTTGTAVGIKARSKLFNAHVILAAAVTNGSFTTEQFHFFSEIDTNAFKTGGSRRHQHPDRQLHPRSTSGSGDARMVRPTGAARWVVGVDAELQRRGSGSSAVPAAPPVE